ncbi:MAG: hypothetical protein KJ069_28820 [Anaerolineae bacterium]|nr:hypothetical protein [Anaerolineae bacterium]
MDKLSLKGGDVYERGVKGIKGDKWYFFPKNDGRFLRPFSNDRLLTAVTLLSVYWPPG